MHQAPPEQPQLDYFCRVLSESAPRGSTVLRASGKQSTQAPIKNKQNKFNLWMAGKFASSAGFDPSFQGKIEIVLHQAQHIDL